MAFTLTGDDVCQSTLPTSIPDPCWVAFSPSAAKLVNIPLNENNFPLDQSWLPVLAGNELSTSKHQFSNPIATVYSGHQFGVWAGQLGDGRAILLGDIAGQELQLKGAGKTQFSRMGDGRAVLRSSIREFLCSEAMYALGIPTTRALSIVGSDLPVRRETMETAAVCARLAPSFIRVGHFEHFASLQNIERLKELADSLMQQHYPDCLDVDNPYLVLFKAICERNAKLVAQWQAVSFCHGVLNSDNISVLGLTMDYGPYGFLDQFQIDHICNHSDRGGRYAYHRQPQIMHWNMACLASAMIPLVELQSGEAAQNLLREVLEEFPVIYAQTWQDLFRKKLGFLYPMKVMSLWSKGFCRWCMSLGLILRNSFEILVRSKWRCTLHKSSLKDDFINREEIERWFSDYIARLRNESIVGLQRQEMMNLVNPKYVLRNHLAQIAIEKAQNKDFSEVEKLLNILSKPYAEQSEYESYATSPPDNFPSVEVSCSS